MGFRHYITKEVVNNEVRNVDEADILANKVVVVDGIPMLPELAAFCNRLKRQMRNWKFAVSNGCSFYTGSVRAYESVHVYVEGEKYVRGMIGYGPFLASSNTNKYMVMSRKIQNNKYNPHREQYNMNLTGNLEAAIKFAHGFLSPYSPIDMAVVTGRQFMVHVDDARDAIKNKSTRTRRDLINHEDLCLELVSLVDSGHKFINPNIRELVERMVAERKEAEEYLAKVRTATFVYVHEQNGEQVVTYLKAPTSFANGLRSIKGTDILDQGTVRGEDFDKGIAARVASLSMLESNSYVEGVGFKVSDDTYWVEQEEG